MYLTGSSVGGDLDERAGALVQKLRRIPDDAREFRLSTADAAAILRVRPALLDMLVGHGLPTRHLNGIRYFDRHDVTNCALHLGSGAIARAARRFWPAALRRTHGAARYEVQYQARCPQPGHAPTCDWVLVGPDGLVVERTVRPDEPPFRMTAACVDAWPELPPESHPVLDETRDLEFMMLPTAVRYDVDFIRATGLSDCAGASRLLVQEAVRRGLTARSSYGLIVAPPFAVEHFWAEIAVDGVWVPVDPVLLRAMVTWGGLPSPEWHPYRSIGAILARVADAAVVLASHEGRSAPVTLPSRVVPMGAP
ncbi:transglutaminase domain-containing protein [Micromonospora okii]|uniref:transglutaminase domain-containing protein n=1 Tax=Micromonospora okii TaxID=1182970 RepID=UPI001E2D3DB7|nr:transglutaminase domain-containing protein [Micromonospora okii]